MEVQQLPIYHFLEGSGKTFIVPVYQRDYAWTKVNCQKLWEDLAELIKKKREDHFLGTIVTIGRKFEEYTIIDGQQRITTISIFLIALHNYLENKKKLTNEEKNLKNQILDFLINKYSPEQNKRVRLKPNKQDKKHFENLFTNKEQKDNDSNILNNYYFFYDKISSNILTPKQLFEAFRKLNIVLITLKEQDNPQLIFESLNSTGVDLTAGDLIRNYILMDLKPFEQKKFYNEYWVKIENLTSNVAEFVRNYLIFKLKTWVKRDDVYYVFKKFSITNFKKNKEKILKDLLYFAEIYAWLIQTKKQPNEKINTQLNRLNKLEITVFHPYLLDVFNDLKNNTISKKEVQKILPIIESYVFRKIIVDNTTQGLNKMFITLSKEIKKEKNWSKEYLNILNYILLQKQASQRFPTNEEFENALINKEIYRLQTKNRNFLLQSLENYNSAYPINIDNLTIEHIMPQTLTKEWKNKLGKNWPEIHKKYLHTLGNLSLTAKNTKLSNNTFEEKQKIDYQTSKLKLNYTLEKTKDWTEKEITNRAKNLIKIAKKIWPYPQTTYTKTKQEEQIYDLTSEDDFTGTKLSKLYLEDEKTIELKTWRDLLKNVCKHLYEFSPTQFTEIEKKPNFKKYFEKNSLRQPIQFKKNKYVEANMSANGIISFLSKISKAMNYSPEKISFSIKNTTD